MCKNRTKRKERHVGGLIQLCADYPSHLAKILGIESGLSVAESVFAAFNASVAIVEANYFDLDYRSEFSIIQQYSFSANNPQTLRVHFFRVAPPTSKTPLRDFVNLVVAATETAANDESGYRGYAIIRPGYPPSIGRSLITPYGQCADLRNPSDLATHVRTAVSETIDLFGVTLSAFGVPFMEQDGQLLRCAHVTAWMAHYTAVLHGIVPRRPSAQFNLIEDPTRSYGRSFPSEGITTFSQSQILRRLDLPPDVLDLARLEEPRELAWYDREQLICSLESAARDTKRTWFAENLTSAIARYLNSGMPAILNRDDHSLLVCGYLRAEDLASPDADAGTEVCALLVHDDQEGPFRVLPLKDILEPYLARSAFPLDVVIPLPKGLWLSGLSAERAGAAIFATIVQTRFSQLDGRPRDWYSTPETFDQMRDRLRELTEAVSSPRPNGRFAIRSYALTGTDFKIDFARRIADENAQRLCGYTPLLKYVWVIEVIDRDLRAKGHSPAVVGTLVLDGSAVSDDGVARPPAPLVAHIPGQFASLGHDHVFAEKTWLPTHANPYFSGRWNHRHSGFLSPVHFAARSKGAVAHGQI